MKHTAALTFALAAIGTPFLYACAQGEDLDGNDLREIFDQERGTPQTSAPPPGSVAPATTTPTPPATTTAPTATPSAMATAASIKLLGLPAPAVVPVEDAPVEAERTEAADEADAG